MNKLFTLFFLIFLQLIFYLSAEYLELTSFQPPFQVIDYAGNRQPSKFYRASGSTLVNQNFIRLTPDRQSKRGAVWSRQALGVNSFTSVLKFRISGQGKKFFGDGMALWFTQQSYHLDGELHGFTDHFIGFGIILDTFVNTESSQHHKDVMLIYNDGTKSMEEMIEQSVGCDASYRYHNARSDFSVTSASKLKVVYKDNNIEIFIDPKNSGEWTHCTSLDNVPLPPNWSLRAHVGLTASTGQLADNHDVIYIRNYSDDSVADEIEKTLDEMEHITYDPELPPIDAIKNIESVINKYIESEDNLSRHIELQFVKVTDDLKNLIGKLEKREDRSEDRLTVLEKDVVTQLDEHIEQRLSNLERLYQNKLDRKVKNYNTGVYTRVETMKAISKESYSRVPLFFIIFLGISGSVGYYLFYRNVKKHIF